MPFEGYEKRKNLFRSMGILALVVVAAGLVTMIVTNYIRSQDPIYQCIDNPAAQPFQLSIPIVATENGVPSLVPKGIGISGNCIHPVHTLKENVIHVAYRREYNFTLGHFLYYWMGTKLQTYNVKVYLDNVQYKKGNILDIPLRKGESIRIDFITRSQ